MPRLKDQVRIVTPAEASEERFRSAAVREALDHARRLFDLRLRRRAEAVAEARRPGRAKIKAQDVEQACEELLRGEPPDYAVVSGAIPKR